MELLFPELAASYWTLLSFKRKVGPSLDGNLFLRKRQTYTFEREERCYSQTEDILFGLKAGPPSYD